MPCHLRAQKELVAVRLVTVTLAALALVLAGAWPAEADIQWRSDETAEQLFKPGAARATLAELSQLVRAALG